MEETEIISELARIAREEGVFGIELAIRPSEGDAEGEERCFSVRLMPRAQTPPAPVATDVPAGLPATAADLPASAAEGAKSIIRATLVGLFHRGLQPGGKPLVVEGQEVTAGQPVCCIESLKVFREVASEVDGVVTAILVDDEEPVDYGKPLFEVRPHA